MKINEITEGRHDSNWTKNGVEMCSKECCGQPVTECTCGPTCNHCDCYEKNKSMKETVAGSVASSMGGGNGFAGGGPGTVRRLSKKKSKNKKA